MWVNLYVNPLQYFMTSPDFFKTLLFLLCKTLFYNIWRGEYHFMLWGWVLVICLFWHPHDNYPLFYFSYDRVSFLQSLSSYWNFAEASPFLDSIFTNFIIVFSSVVSTRFLFFYSYTQWTFRTLVCTALHNIVSFVAFSKVYLYTISPSPCSAIQTFFCPGIVKFSKSYFLIISNVSFWF